MLLSKYKPSSLEDFVGNKTQLFQIKEWIKNPSKPLLLHGPPGCGKTLAAEIIASEMGLELVSHQFFSPEHIEKSSLQQSLFFSGKLIVIDELDGIRSLRGLADVIKKTKHPIILIANDIYIQKLSSIRSKCLAVKFSKIRYDSVQKFLKNICEKENYEFDEPALRQISMSCDGDIRAAIMDIELLKPSITLSSLQFAGYRERKENIFTTLKIIFHSTDMKNVMTALDNSDTDLDGILRWMNENITHISSEHVAEAFELLSKADINSSRIMRRQSYSLLKYNRDFISSFSLLNPKKSFSPYRPPRFYRASSFSPSLLEKISSRLHIPKKDAADYFQIIRSDPEAFSLFFNFTEEEIEEIA